MVLLKLITCNFFWNPIRAVFCLIENQQFVNSLLPIALNVKTFKISSCKQPANKVFHLFKTSSYSRHQTSSGMWIREASCEIDHRPVTGLCTVVVVVCGVDNVVCCLSQHNHSSTTTMSLTGWLRRPLDPGLFEWVSTTMGEIDDTLFIKQITL